jgi:hypothetical protein
MLVVAAFWVTKRGSQTFTGLLGLAIEFDASRIPHFHSTDETLCKAWEVAAFLKILLKLVEKKSRFG